MKTNLLVKAVALLILSFCFWTSEKLEAKSTSVIPGTFSKKAPDVKFCENFVRSAKTKLNKAKNDYWKLKAKQHRSANQENAWQRINKQL